MGDASEAQEAKITLYTNHGCPWAHRAHIAVAELGLKYEEVIIDLDTPRPDWYLKINPRGLVPAITYTHPSLPSEVTVLESGLVVHFLLDAYPQLSSSLWPAPASQKAAYFRYRVNFFVDTYFSKVNSLWFKVLFASGSPDEESKADEYIKAVKEHIEPLLHDAGPFFGGSKSMTLAEIQTASFILRLYDFTNDDLVSSSMKTKLEEQCPNFAKWAKATVGQKSVTYIWDSKVMADKFKERLPKMREKYGAAAK